MSNTNLKQDKNLSFLVADQYPQANTQLNKNEPVDITIYSYEGLKNQQRPCNANQIAMPDLSGLYDMYAAEEVSKYLYDNAGICANIKFETWPNQKQDKNISFTVADQYPMADTPLNKNETVNITIYSYEGVKDQQRPCNANQIPMPELCNKDEADELVTYLYNEAGICASIKVEYWNTTDKALDGKIASQYPVAEAPLDKNKPIDVTIYVYKYTESSTTITNTTQKKKNY